MFTTDVVTVNDMNWLSAIVGGGGGGGGRAAVFLSLAENGGGKGGLRYFEVHIAVCEEPAISLHSHHVSLVQWTTHLLPVTRDPGSKPLGGLL